MPSQAAVRWWEDEAAVPRRLAGVFEGGGAKGVAYVGALRATLDKGCWFGAVAGASAGAISAALIAAGLTPDEFEKESEEAFKRISPGSRFEGIRRLRLNFGALDNEKVHEWLEAKLAEQVAKFGVEAEGPVTFATLYRATGIELNVVAADLSRSRQIIFSAWETPAVQVTDAVLGSSSIPLAFAARHLRVPAGDGAWTHTITDGGVWSNFPTFVFADRSFRKSVGRPQVVSEHYIVGYLLDEQDHVEDDVSGAAFVGLAEAPDPREWQQRRNEPTEGDKGLGSRAKGLLARAVLTPLSLVLRAGAWLSLGNGKAWRGRWPQPAGPMGFAMRVLDDLFSALHSSWLAVAAAVAIFAGAALAVYHLVDSFLLLLVHKIRLDLAFGLRGGTVVDLLQIALAVMVIGLIIAVAVLVVVALAANYVLLGPVRQVMFGLARTYAAGPGAPPWAGAGEGDHVVRLPITKRLTTLSFDRSRPEVAEAIAEAIEAAYRTTAGHLDGVLKTPALEGPPRQSTPEQATAAATGAPAAATAPVRGPAFAMRLSLISVAAVAALWVASVVLPDPAWHRFDTNVRICAEPMRAPDAPCEQPAGEAMHATVLFGPPAAGHTTEAVVTVDGRVVERSNAVPNPREGRILNLRLNRREICGEPNCQFTVTALVNGNRVYGQKVQKRTTVDIARQ